MKFTLIFKQISILTQFHSYKLLKREIVFHSQQNKINFMQNQFSNSCPIDEYLYQKPQPNISIKLQPVQQQIKHTFTCQCQMCRQYDAKKVIEILNQKTLRLNRKIQEKIKDGKVPSEYFLQILKKLQLPHHKIVKRGIDIYIPEICFFKDGQIKGMYMNRQVDDFTIKKIHKNSVTPGLIQRILNERRREYRQDIKKKLGISDRRPLSQSKPSSNHQQKKQPPITSTTQQKDSVVIKYTDGLQSMIPETQFIMLTLRRKQDPIWRTIQTIRNSYAVNDQIRNLFFVKYERDNIRFRNLLDRARTLVKIYAEIVIPGESRYLSPEEEGVFAQQLLRKNKKTFAEYVVYKIVAFVQYFHDEEITKLSCRIVLNELQKPYLIDVTSYKKRTLMRFVWTNDTYKKKVQNEEKKVLDEREIYVTEDIQAKSNLITNVMEQKYTQLKNKNGISLQESDNQEEIKNNQFWKKIHPEFQGIELSQLLVKQKHLTTDEFKKKYLGYKEERKPLVKGFSNHLIKVLHKTTPKLKLSQFHEVSSRPNESGYFSSQRPSTERFSKRSSFSVLTSYTKPESKQEENAISSSRSIKRKSSMVSRTPSSSYRRSTKPGRHLHIDVGQFSITKDFLDFNNDKKNKKK